MENRASTYIYIAISGTPFYPISTIAPPLTVPHSNGMSYSTEYLAEQASRQKVNEFNRLVLARRAAREIEFLTPKRSRIRPIATMILAIIVFVTLTLVTLTPVPTQSNSNSSGGAAPGHIFAR